MRPLYFRILGIMLMGAGAFWALQGLGVISYEMIPSFMAGNALWVRIGGMLFVFGLLILIGAIRAGKRSS